MSVNLYQLWSHPLAPKFSQLMEELERLPADPRQTDLVTQLDALRRATEAFINREEPPAPPPKIVRIDNRQPYEPPAEKPEPGKPCSLTVELCEELLDRAEMGELTGVCVIGWNPKEQRFLSVFGLPLDEPIEESSLRYIGALDLLRLDMLDAAENGLWDNTPEGFEIEGDYE